MLVTAGSRSAFEKNLRECMAMTSADSTRLPVGGEMMFKPWREFEIGHDIAAAKRSDQWQQERRRALRRAAPAWCRQGRDERAERCNSP